MRCGERVIINVKLRRTNANRDKHCIDCDVFLACSDGCSLRRTRKMNLGSKVTARSEQARMACLSMLNFST